MKKPTPKKGATKKATSKQKKAHILNDPKGKILPNVKFNLFVIVIMLCMILLLFSALIYIQNKVIDNLVENKKVDYFDKNFREYNLERLTLQQFGEVTNTSKMISMADIEAYMVREGFNNIEVDKGFIQGELRGQCFEDSKWNEELCRVVVLRFIQEKGIYIEIVRAKEFSN